MERKWSDESTRAGDQPRASKSRSILFTPLEIKGLRLKNRIVLAPIVTGFTGDLTVTEKTKDFYVARALGGAGLIMVETGMVDIASAGPTCMGIYDDKIIPGLRDIVDAVHASGALAGIQLQHQGRQGQGTYGPMVAPSPLPWGRGQEVPKELSRTEVRTMVERYGEAARRAKEAGFDLVEVHGAHGYLVNEFLSPQSNIRNDEYGGDLDGRMRFALEIIKSIREK